MSNSHAIHRYLTRRLRGVITKSIDRTIDRMLARVFLEYRARRPVGRCVRIVEAATNSRSGSYGALVRGAVLFTCAQLDGVAGRVEDLDRVASTLSDLADDLARRGKVVDARIVSAMAADLSIGLGSADRFRRSANRASGIAFPDTTVVAVTDRLLGGQCSIEVAAADLVGSRSLTGRAIGAILSDSGGGSDNLLRLEAELSTSPPLVDFAGWSAAWFAVAHSYRMRGEFGRAEDVLAALTHALAGRSFSDPGGSGMIELERYWCALEDGRVGEAREVLDRAVSALLEARDVVADPLLRSRRIDGDAWQDELVALGLACAHPSAVWRTIEGLANHGVEALLAEERGVDARSYGDPDDLLREIAKAWRSVRRGSPPTTLGRLDPGVAALQLRAVGVGSGVPALSNGLRAVAGAGTWAPSIDAPDTSAPRIAGVATLATRGDGVSAWGTLIEGRLAELISRGDGSTVRHLRESDLRVLAQELIPRAWQRDAGSIPTNLLITPHGPLGRFPISALPVAGDRTLGECTSIAYCPSVGVYVALPATAHRIESVLYVGVDAGLDAANGVDGVGREIDVLTELGYRVRRAYSWRDMCRWTAHVDMLVLGVHGDVVDGQNVFRLPSGEEVRSSRLGSLRLPPVVVAAACWSGVLVDQPTPLSLVPTLLAGGSTAAIISLWDIDSRVATDVLCAFYARLADNPTSVPSALGDARNEASRAHGAVQAGGLCAVAKLCGAHTR